MCKWFKEMDCYVLTEAENKPKCSLNPFDRRAKLEQSFRNYAAVFDKVKLVIKKNQAKEEFLNFPHLCDETEENHSITSIAKALKDSDSDAVFIGSAEIYDFPISLLSNLLKSYQGEAFLGYASPSDNGHSQPLFGIYNKKLSSSIGRQFSTELSLKDLPEGDVKLLSLPDEIDSSCIGL